jgi:hypothetical protein
MTQAMGAQRRQSLLAGQAVQSLEGNVHRLYLQFPTNERRRTRAGPWAIGISDLATYTKVRYI